MQTFKNVQLNGWSCSPIYDPAQYTVLKKFFVWMIWSVSKTFKDMVEPCFPKHGLVLFTVLKNLFVWMLWNQIKLLKSLLGRAPQHSLSRPSSFRGAEESFRYDVMQSVNNVQINGWSCSTKHDPVHFTVFNNLLVWMVWSFSITFKVMVAPCFLKHGQVFFTVCWRTFSFGCYAAG